MVGAGSRSDRATVIGAGIVGICTALSLQRAGFEVTLVDPGGPGEGASSGNAGHLAVWLAAPLGVPGMIARVPKMLLDPQAAVAIRWGYLPRIAPWLLRLLLASRPRRVEEISLALAALLRRARDDFDPLIESAAAKRLVVRRNYLAIYESRDAFRASAGIFRLVERRGARIPELGADEIRQLEPALGPAVKYARLVADVTSVIDPLEFSRTLCADFTHRGGTFVRAAATGFALGPNGPERVLTTAGDLAAGTVVIAAGAFSHPLAAELGSRVPLDTERGYHVMLADPGITLRTSMSSGDGGFGIVTMAKGLRLAGTIEFGGLRLPPNPARWEAMLARARRLFPGLREGGQSRWMGFRPSLPDSLPVLGRSPRYPRVFFAFGHSHLGLTLAATSGRLIADLASGRAPAVDLTPYRPDRF
ncbi:MAG: FAD-binding oxidoreductase [Proteobacteria bacterium]|nr:FAD-binding oxidoreductase [Pseudomonadota bacterium]